MGNSFSQMATFEIGTVVEGYTDNQRENEYIVQLIGAALQKMNCPPLLYMILNRKSNKSEK